ncbi:beta strand repeat-containing protein, partial [Flavilitoribacter nigricans]
VNYDIEVLNDGNISIYNVVVTDPGADAGTILPVDADTDGFNDGDTDEDGVLDVGETWLYTAAHTITQDDIDDGFYTNTATVNAVADTNGDGDGNDAGVGDVAVTDSDDETVNATQVPSIMLTKTANNIDGVASPTTYDAVGDVVNYDIEVLNDGNVSIYNVVVTDPGADAGTILPVDADTDGFNDGDTDENGVLDVGETWLYTAAHTITQDDIDDGLYTNTATVNAVADTNGDGDGNDAGVGDVAVTDSDDETVNAAQAPSIMLTKTANNIDGVASPTTYDAVGDVVNYDIAVLNDGNVSIYNVLVTDPGADAGTILPVDADTDGFNDGDTDEDGVLDVGETWLYTAAHTITQDDIDDGLYTNTATVNGVADTNGDGDGNDAGVGDVAVTDSDDETVNATQAPSIMLTKTANNIDGVASPTTYDAVGDVVNYDIAVLNDGNVSIYNVVVTDPGADAGTILPVDADTDGFNDGDTDEDGVLDVGETWLYTAAHTITQDDIDDGLYTNTATVNAVADTNGDGDGNDAGVGDVAVMDSDDETVNAAQDPSIMLTKTANNIDGVASPTTYDAVGDVVNYDIAVLNDGNVSIYNVVVTDPGADAGTILPVDADTDGFNDGDTDEDGVLDVGETWLYTAAHTITQDDIDDGLYTNTATVNGVADTNGDGDGNDAGVGDVAVTDSDDETVNAAQAPSIMLTKTANNIDGVASPTTYDAVGDVVNYDIAVLNDGNVSIYNVVVTDPGADAGTILPVDADTDGFNDGDTDEDGVLDVGETWLYTAAHTITQDDIDDGLYTNTATVNAVADTNGDGDGNDAGVGDVAVTDSDDETVNAAQAPSIMLTKTANNIDGLASPTTYDAVGDVVNYDIEVLNDGNVSIYNVVVTDPGADAGTILPVDADTDGFNDGDTDEDGVLDVGETWLYTAAHTITQDDIDDGFYTNTATVNAVADTNGDGDGNDAGVGDVAVTDSDDETVNAA